MVRKITAAVEDLSFAQRRSTFSENVKTAFRLSAGAYVVLIYKTLEKFTFYGTQNILPLFFKNRLNFSQDASYLVYHIFLAIYYLFPLFGAILSDNYFGRFKTVAVSYALSLVGYTIITGVACYQEGHALGFLIGIFTIAICTGASNPCVIAFGGDQVSSRDPKKYDIFFSCLYIMINISSMLGLYAAPLLHSNITCFDEECYPLSFGVLTSVGLIGYVIFVACKPIYEIRFIKSNVITEFVKCIHHALSRWSKERKTLKKSEILDYATDKFSVDFVRDAKSLISLCILYAPLPLFWALYFQQFSLWKEQAENLSGYVSPSVSILPEQMAIFNPAMICVLVPLFEIVIFPCAKKINILQSRTTRMIVGFVLAILAFVYAGFLQIGIEDNFNTIIKSPKCQVHMVNLASSKVNVNSTHANVPKSINSMAYKTFTTEGKAAITFKVSLNNVEQNPLTHKFKIQPRLGGSVSLFLVHGVNDSLSAYQGYSTPDIKGSHSKFRLIIGFEPLNNFTIYSLTPNGTKIDLFHPRNATDRLSDYFQLPHGNYSLYLVDNDSQNVTHLGTILSKNSWVSTIGISSGINENTYEFLVVKEFRVSLLSILLQIPMYFLISCSEILVYITMLAFAYNEAPESMKAVTQSIVHLTNFFGNIIVILVRLGVKKQNSVILEIFVFCGLSVIGCFIYSALCVRYNKAKVKQNKYGEFLDDFVRYQMNELRTDAS